MADPLKTFFSPELVRRLAADIAVHTTRKPRPGRHEVEALVKGLAFRAGSFTVVEHRA